MGERFLGIVDNSQSDATDSEQVEDLVAAAHSLVGTDKLWSGQLLYTSVQLGILDVLGDEPTSASVVADELDLHADNCYRLLRALSHFDVLEEDHDRRFTLTPVGELFRPDHPNSVRHHLLVDRSPEWVLPMLHLEAIVDEGDPNGFVREFGLEFFDYLEENPEFAQVFNDHMTGRSQQETALVLDALDAHDFSECSHICDVGGGHGHLACRLLEAYPHLDGTVLELPSVIAEEDRLWAPKLGVEDRCTYEVGDMFEAVPEADAYFLKSILHDWDDADCVHILSTIAEAAPRDGRLFVIEAIVPGPEASHFAKRLDMTMMVHVGGRERTEAEYAALFEKAGWELVETWVPEAGPFSILEAAKS
jgi:hypothetical protein